MLFARLNAARKLFDGVRLIAARLVIAHEFEVHRLGQHGALTKPRRTIHYSAEGRGLRKAHDFN